MLFVVGVDRFDPFVVFSVGLAVVAVANDVVFEGKLPHLYRQVSQRPHLSVHIEG